MKKTGEQETVFFCAPAGMGSWSGSAVCKTLGISQICRRNVATGFDHCVQNVLHVQNAASWVPKFAVGAHFCGCVWTGEVCLRIRTRWCSMARCTFSQLHRPPVKLKCVVLPAIPRDETRSCFARLPYSHSHKKKKNIRVCVGLIFPPTNAHQYPRIFRGLRKRKKGLPHRPDPLPSTPPNLSLRPYRTGVLYDLHQVALGPVCLAEPKEVVKKGKRGCVHLHLTMQSFLCLAHENLRVRKKLRVCSHRSRAIYRWGRPLLPELHHSIAS